MKQLPQFTKIYPGTESIVFDGGLDTKFEKALLPENESPDCLNVEFSNGSVATRQGAVKLNPLAAGGGGNAFDGIYTRRASDSSETMCAFINGSMYTLGVTTFNTVPSAQSVFTIGARVGTDLAENYIFIGNGVNGPYKWDGTNFTQHGVSAPVATASVASFTTGSLVTNGVYMWKVTHVNSALVESNLGPAVTFTVSSAGLAVALTNIPVASFPSQGISSRRVYRTLNGGSSFFRVTTLNDNTTTTYTDTTADANLGTAAPTDNGVPPQYNAICYLANILFVNDIANPNYVWYSTAGQPYTFPSTNFFKVGDKTSDLVKGFAAYDNYLVVFCEQSTFINFMPNPADSSTWRQIRTNSPYGSKSPYCLLRCNVKGEDVLLHPAVQNKKFVGFGALKGATLDPSISFQAVTAAGSDLQSQPIETDMFSVQETYLNNISGIVYKNKAYLSLTYSSGNTTNNRVYQWDFSISNLKKEQKAVWVPWTGTPFNIQQFTIYGGKLYAATSSTSGFVYQIGDTGVYSDDGAAINSYWWSKEFAGYEEDTSTSKDFRSINMLIDNAGSYYMNLRYRTDSDLGVGTTMQVDLTSGGTVWGTGANGLTWGVGLWGGGTNQTDKRVFLGAVRGKRLQFGFDNQNTINQRFKVHHAQFRYNIRGYR
jgi:hypothetical protein